MSAEHPHAPAGGRLVLVHGFTQTGRSMGPLARRLEHDFEVVSPDLAFHGPSPVETEDLEGAAELLGETGRAAYLGYSLGGRVCLTLALEHPELVEALVLIGATPGIEDETERAARRADDDALARRLDPAESDALGLEEFLDLWLAGPLFAHLSEEQADVQSRRPNTAAGLAGALRHLGTGTQRPSHHRLAALEMPVLCLAGEADAKFREIAEVMGKLIGENASVVVVPGAGHAAPAEAPDFVAEETRRFLLGI